MTLSKLREELPIAEDSHYFLTGSHGPAPISVLNEFRNQMEFEAEFGLQGGLYKKEIIDREHDSRTALATFLGVTPTEISITGNTSEAMQKIIRSFSWEKNSELVVSSLEHVSTFSICRELSDRYGVIIKIVEADTDESIFLESFQDALSESTKLVIVSQIASPDGRLLPVERVVNVAKEKGIPVAVDAAQSIGQFSVDIKDIKCDFLVGSGHKWLLGPMGIGFLYVNNEYGFSNFRPEFIPDVKLWHQKEDPLPPLDLKQRAEVGTYSHAKIIALGKALNNINQIGFSQITSHVQSLSSLLSNAVSKMQNTRMITPINRSYPSGLISLKVEGRSAKDIQNAVAEMEREKILLKFQWLTAPYDIDKFAIRISLAMFNTNKEVNHLNDALKTYLG